MKFFEFGNCYYFDADKKNPEKVLATYSEDYHLGLWVTGKKVANSWAHPDENSSVYELKAYVENILKRLGLDLHNLVVGNLTDDIFATALSVHTKGGKRLASFGVVTKKLLKEVELFDVYEGKNIEAGKKSYAVSFLLQDETQTLNDKMIDKIMSKLVKNLEDKLNAKLR